jgi:hypothetical protein
MLCVVHEWPSKAHLVHCHAIVVQLGHRDLEEYAQPVGREKRIPRAFDGLPVSHVGGELCTLRKRHEMEPEIRHDLIHIPS